MKLYLAIGAAMLFGTGVTLAQSGTGTAPVHAAVSVDLKIEDLRGMEVGIIKRLETKVVPHGFDHPSGMKTAQFEVLGDQNDIFVVQGATGHMSFIPGPGYVPAVGDVTTMDGTNPTFSAWLEDLANGENLAAGDVKLPGAQWALLGNDGDLWGKMFLWVGMTWNAHKYQQRGNYAGDVVVTLAYL